MAVNRHISISNAVVTVSTSVVATLILLVLSLITVNLLFVNWEAWIMLSAGLIFLGVGAAEWTWDLSVSYYNHLLGVGIKQFMTLLLASIGLEIMNSMYVGAQNTGWVTDLQALAVAFASALIR